MTMHWTKVSSMMWNILVRHKKDHLSYMRIIFSSGYVVRSDYLAELHQQIIIDIENYQDSELFLLDSCIIDRDNMSETFISLDAMLEGNHYDDEVEYMLLIFGTDDGYIRYTFNGDDWDFFCHTYEDELPILKWYYDHGVISNSELMDLAILACQNSTFPGNEK